MTPEKLIEMLADEIGKITKDVPLHDTDGKKCHFHMFEQTLPRPQADGDEEKLFPYCVVRFEQNRVIDVRERQPVDIVLDFGIYYDNPDCQYQHTFFSVFEKIKRRFIINNFLGSFRAEPKMAFALSEEDDITYPFYYAGAKMTWMIPGIEREDEFS